MACEGGWPGRERLRRPRLFAGDVALFYGTLLDFEQWASRDTVEHEDEAGLGDLRDGGDLAAVADDGHEVRLRGQVPIPQVMVDGLEMPTPFAGTAVEGNDAIAEQVGALAVAAVEVDRGRGEWNEDHPALLVDAHRRPGIGAAALVPGVALPSVVAVLAGTRHGVEAPGELACAGVESTDVTARPLRLAVADPSADDHHVAARRHRRGVAVAQVGILVGQHALFEINHAADTESRDRACVFRYRC